MKKWQQRDGFTLIELIAIIVLAALALVAILPFMGETFLRSHEPRTQLVHALDLQSAMEDLVAAYTNELSSLHHFVGPVGGTVAGRFVVIENAFVEFTYPGLSETGSADEHLLKITIGNEVGDRVTRLFSVPL